ncbi:hypothetical protein WN944_001681 [Citrus x changshan-huyou]|uniref:NB-ARC domain-containing protein n=1 Tax=Citrus x changshan-huyou TaxID=2935761 RepID=A0AAP0MH07_9ROSI
MGGIGKTTVMKHVHNELLKETKFDTAIWVTVSQEFDVEKIQKSIASALNKSISAEGIAMRAAELSKMLKERKRYVLILDDVWEIFSLDEVGIPEPTVENGCKLVLTTRSKKVAELASSMRDVKDVDLWKNALNELKENSTSVEGMADEVIPRLKFSYDRLMDPKIKRCFLYCALYPEDFDIPKEELTEYWIVKGLIDEMETRQAMHDKGIDILVKAGKIRPLLLEEEWKDDVEKVSLMRCRMTEIPFNAAFSNCRTLSTLLLQDNDIREIPESFFEHMIGLKILDLSKNVNLRRLPNSISGLINLTALMVHRCSDMQHVPCLAKLGALEKLDLGGTKIDVVPQGLEMLTHLTYLDLNSYRLRKIPGGMLSNPSRIQHLRLDYIALENAEDILRLTNLEIFGVRFDNLQDYHQKWNGYVSFQGLRICENSVVLPHDIQELHFYACGGMRSLRDVPSLKDTTDLRECVIYRCEQMEFVFCLSSCYGILETLEYLGLERLDNLKAIFQIAKDEVNASSLRTKTPSPPNIVLRLKSLNMSHCGKLQKLFPPELLPWLQNLEEIKVGDCGGLEEIIAKSDDDEEGENNEAAGNNSTKSLALPKLRFLGLKRLPNLMSICSRRSTIVCNSLETIYLIGCPKIKRMPVLLPHLVNGQPLDPRSLRIYINKDRWDALEWDDRNSKSLLTPFCIYEWSPYGWS